MVNREMRKVELVSFEPGADKFGQQMTKEVESREIDMTFTLYSHQADESPLYQDVNYFGLTREKGIADKQVIRVDGHDHKILFVNNFSRLTQVFMA